MCSYRTVYRFIKQILFFSYFLSLNIYSSPIFILCQCCQQICNLVTYFLGVCIGGGIVGMDIWSRIFVEELRTIFKVCVCLDKRRGGQPNVHRCGQGGGGWGGRRGVKNHWKCSDILYGRLQNFGFFFIRLKIITLQGAKLVLKRLTMQNFLKTFVDDLGAIH